MYVYTVNTIHGIFERFAKVFRCCPASAATKRADPAVSGVAQCGAMGKRVALLSRVSTEEQSLRGYSIREQMRELEEYAAKHGLEVVGRLSDEGFSGADPDRPGLRRVMELAEAREIDVIISTKRDRIFRSRLYRLLLERDLNEYGVEIVALNDMNHTLGDGLLDSFAEYEREEITRRTMAGKLQKAREGKIVAGRLPVFGFDFSEDKNHYVINEAKMAAVRRAFALVASGEGIRGACRKMGEEGFPTPGNSPHGRWPASSMRNIILDDSYFPHTIDELRPLLSNAVHSSLDPAKLYGIWFYNRREAVKTRRGRKIRQKPREEWIAVPVPDSGVPGEVAELARQSIEKNEKNTRSRVREYELSHGILKCGHCGGTIKAHHSAPLKNTTYPSRKKYRAYYRCDRYRKKSRDPAVGGCDMSRNLSAVKIEERVWKAVRDVLLSPEKLDAALRGVVKGKGRKSDPDKLTKLSRRLSELERRRDGYLELGADGVMPRSELSEKLGRVDGEITTLRGEADSLALQADRERASKEDARLVLSRLKVHAPEILDALDPAGRRAMYKALDLRIEVSQEPGVRGEEGTSYRASWLVESDLTEMLNEDDGEDAYRCPGRTSIRYVSSAVSRISSEKTKRRFFAVLRGDSFREIRLSA